MKLLKTNLRKILSLKVRASFTIEAAVILPIIFTIIVWLISFSFKVHNQVLAYSTAINSFIENAPLAPESDNPYADRFDASNLDGRQILLKYKLLKDGIHSITGGLDDED